MNTVLRFAKKLTQYDPLLQERVEGLYHKIFEGQATVSAVDNLKAQVGDNHLETEGDGVFGLTAAAGYDEGTKPEEVLDSAIDKGVTDGALDDFGTAIPEESLPPTEDDLGFGSDPDETFGNDLGADDSLFADDGMEDDTGASDDLGLDGLDDEFPEDEPPAEPEGNSEEPPAETDGEFEL
jgi:hypothetical protein